ncbi:vascular endothelial growth factor B isoform X3 [Elephas maximus indicus]|uniref:vascular endothelial growth factor B isoform X3 n=1 Tax=Elephas maximus indicus TaxID=99487 RepID=UPI0021170214|nr:vascular endothelial growth factor B isoform X3 [Elephas maximus indicus]
MRASPARGPRGHHGPPAPPPAARRAPAAGPRPGTCGPAARCLPCPLKVGGSGEARASAEGAAGSSLDRGIAGPEHPPGGAPPAASALGPLPHRTPSHPSPGRSRGRSHFGACRTWFRRPLCPLLTCCLQHKANREAWRFDAACRARKAGLGPGQVPGGQERTGPCLPA